jgi:RNA polymerase sigma-70 factor (ECF subfamily)
MRMSTAAQPDLPERLAAAREGSVEALGDALNEFRDYLLRVARRQLPPDLLAKGGASDLVQETFLEAQQRFDRFEGTSAAELRAWLGCLLRHRAAKLGRRFRTTAKRRLAREVPVETVLADAGRTPSAQVIADEQSQRLQEAMARLPTDYRQVMTLRYLQGLKFEEIGRRMGRSPDAVRMLWARALEAIKNGLRPADGGTP